MNYYYHYDLIINNLVVYIWNLLFNFCRMDGCVLPTRTGTQAGNAEVNVIIEIKFQWSTKRSN